MLSLPTYRGRMIGSGGGNPSSCCFFCCIKYITIYLSLLLPVVSAAGSNETDRLALLEIKSKITKDPLGLLAFWNDSTNFCQWRGVACGTRHRRVTQLLLNSSKLEGSISPHIGNLTFLRYVALTNNSFGAQIPPEIGNLRRLQFLYLNNNSLSGEIPNINISSWSSLLLLVLSGNQLVGGIPGDIGFLPKLQALALRKNHLTGIIPASLGNVSSLTLLHLGFNNLGGTIPFSLGQLRNLTSLDLVSNQLSGEVPFPIYNLSSLTLLYLGFNSLHGYFPADLFLSLPNMQDIIVAFNSFTGSIPSSVSNASNLVSLQFHYNNLTGKVPHLGRANQLMRFYINQNNLGSHGLDDDLNFICSLSNATSLQILSIDTNNIGGPFPKCIVNLSSALTRFWFASNYISGSIPDNIGNLVNLEDFQGWNNKLSGRIPQSIGSLRKLQIIVLDHNELSGNIPSSLGNLTNLNVVDLSSNNLQGTVPSSLGQCRNLEALVVSSNNLNGSFPVEVLSLPSHIYYIGFSSNGLSGPIPCQIGKLLSLSVLDISNNMFSGEIPGDIGSCTSLEYLYMEGNLFQGPIPSSWSPLRGLQQLDLSQNNLSGQIPEYLASFRLLSYLNVSFNELEGSVPIQGVFKNASATSVLGNRKLCGGIPDFHLPACKFHRKTSSKLKLIIGSIAGCLGAIVALSLVLIQCLKNKREKHRASGEENKVLKLSYWDLHKATDGFPEANRIGTGSSGSVYKGTLEAHGSLVAVKVINLQQGRLRRFVAECEALRNTRHRNLVKLLTACSSIDHQGNDFKALVYEFMRNGSLAEWLHPTFQGDGANPLPARSLTLRERLNVAIDVACGLEYLHFQCDSPIVHSDLKPSNVLLDDDLVGHVSDFGLAKILFQGIHNNGPSTLSSSTGLRGTIGYAPPEYGMGSEISTSGDVYSFGITLLEIFTGKRPTDDVFNDGWNLHKAAESSLVSDRGVAEIIDPTLLEEVGESETAGTSRGFNNNTRHGNNRVMLEFLMFVIEVGVACSAESPAERMTISQVSTRLCSIRDKLAKIGNGARFRSGGNR